LVVYAVHTSNLQEERFQALEKLAAAKKEYAMLDKELSAYGACDPAKVEEKQRGGVLAHEAAIRWTGEILTHICGHPR
jgi:hypothetical protein